MQNIDCLASLTPPPAMSPPVIILLKYLLLPLPLLLLVVLLLVLDHQPHQLHLLVSTLRRLLLLTAAPTRSSVVRKVSNADRLAIASGDIELGELSADCVAAGILGAGIAGPIPEESSQRLLRARREGQAKNIDFDIFLHVIAPAVVPSK